MPVASSIAASHEGGNRTCLLWITIISQNWSSAHKAATVTLLRNFMPLHIQKQYHFAYSYLKDEYLAQDALQETYIIALKELSKLQDPMLLVAWLNQINFRVCYQLYRKQKRYASEMTDYSRSETGWVSTSSSIQTDFTPPHLVSADNDPADMAVRGDSREYIMNQILKLPFTEAQVIILKFYQNLKHDEIADLMDISRSSVKRYLNSGKKHLATVLQQQGGGFFL